LVKGKKVLDLGCCVGASAAWVLSAGASHYVGVEIQQKFYKQTVKNLENRFDKSLWDIHKQSVTEFLQTNTKQFDLVIMFGILYQSIYFENLIQGVARTNATHVIIDSIYPLTSINADVREKIKHLPLVEYVENQPMVSESAGNRHIINAARISVPALQVLFWSSGYGLTENHSANLKNIWPDVYNTRFCVQFTKTGDSNLIDFETSYQFSNKTVEAPFDTSVQRKQWSFDSQVSQYFEQHARQHIPRYDEIIDQCVTICCSMLPDRNSKIVDIGCATGETIRKLNSAGFYNLVGVDASNSMLDKVRDNNMATWVHSDQFPMDHAPYNAVLCNWTLHFIKQKIEYLKKIYQGLQNNGILILTDKTANSGIELEMYHNFKRSAGVSESDIANKAHSVKDIMFIDPPIWYISTLTEIGFTDIKIINASPCFTTFMAVKQI
jgi:tRNA (cmo5U34)-methyltransferase